MLVSVSNVFCFLVVSCKLCMDSTISLLDILASFSKCAFNLRLFLFDCMKEDDIGVITGLLRNEVDGQDGIGLEGSDGIGLQWCDEIGLKGSDGIGLEGCDGMALESMLLDVDGNSN